jgi:hypothetical protein
MQTGGKPMRIWMAVPIVSYLFTGCASNTGVVSMGEGTYMASRQDNSFGASAGALKAENLKEAAQFCASKGQDFAVISSVDIPRALGKIPQSTLHFKCSPRSNS